MTEYHCVNSCNKCGGKNDVGQTDSIETGNMEVKQAGRNVTTIYSEGKMCEARTKCTVCGHEDYWAYGFFESMQHIESKCEKYSF
jgi:hypothetical protein